MASVRRREFGKQEGKHSSMSTQMLVMIDNAAVLYTQLKSLDRYVVLCLLCGGGGGDGGGSLLRSFSFSC